MRKFTSFLMSLLAFIGVASAQTFPKVSTADAPKYYKIASYNRGGYLTNMGVGAGVEHVDLTEGSWWYFTQADENGGVYFVNKAGADQYLDANMQVSATPAIWYILANGVNDFGVSISKTNPISGSSCIDANNWSSGVGNWAPYANDWHGTTWVFVSEDAVSFDYIYTCGEDTIKTETVTAEAGDAFPAINTSWGYLAATPEGTVAEGQQNVVIECTLNLPFEYADSYENITKWYYLTISSAKNPLYYNDDVAYIDATKSTKDINLSNADAYSWAFIGNIETGFKLVNKLAGESMILSSPEEPTSDQGENGLARMVAADAVTGNTTWDITGSNGYIDENGFFIAYSGTGKRLNKQAGKVCYWLNGADTGSTFLVSSTIDLLSQLIETAQYKYDNSENGSTVGYYKPITRYYLNKAITTAKAVTEENTDEEIFEAIDALQAQIDAFTCIMPQEGKIYRIISAYTAYEEQQGVEKALYSDGTKPMWGTVETTNLSHYWTVSAVEGGYAIKNYNDSLFINSASAVSADTTAVTLNAIGGGQFNIVAGGATLHTSGHSNGAGDGGTIVNWPGDANTASAWRIVEYAPKAAYTPNGDENVSSIKDIVFTCEYGIALGDTANLTTPTISTYLWDIETQTASTISHDLATTVSGDSIILSVAEEITTEAYWQLQIPDGYFILNPDGIPVASSGIYAGLQVVDMSPLTVTGITPAADSVIEALDITMTFSHDVSEYPNGRGYILNADGDTVSAISISAQDAEGNWFTERNKLRLTAEEKITDDGVYTFALPEGYITKVSDGSGLAATDLSYTLKLPVTISAPILDNEGGIYTDSNLRVRFSVETTGVEGYPSIIYYYTTDGTLPTKESNKGGATLISENCTLNVMAVMTIDSTEYVSEVTTAEYIITQIVPFKKATSIEEIKDGKIFIAANDSLLATSLYDYYTYGYLDVIAKETSNGYLKNAEYYAYTLTAVEGGYTMQDQYGRYIYMTGSYNSFNVSEDMPEEGAVWSIAIAEDGVATITNVAKNKYIQYSAKYGSFGSYADAQTDGVMPVIYVECESPTLTWTPCNGESVENFTGITFTCEQGLALSGNGSAQLTDWMQYIDLTATVVDENTITLTAPGELSKITWTVMIDAGYFILNPGGMNEASEYIYDGIQIADNTPLEVEEVTPAEGTVESLEYIIVTFTRDINPYGDAIINNAAGEQIATATMGYNNPVTGAELGWNQVVYTLTEAITEAGTYTVVLPEGIIYCNNMLAPEYTFTFTVGGEATGIDGIDAENGEQVIFDITGRRIEAITAPGIYIVNGKKVVIK